MPINLFDHVEKKVAQEGEELSDPHVNAFYSQVQLERQARDFEKEATSSLFSKISARLFFLMLLISDVCWGLSSLVQITVGSALMIITLGKSKAVRQFVIKKAIAIRRAFCCGFALTMALFSPALGTMFACSYFLIFDKKGVEEIVPHVLQDQIKEFMQL